MQKVIRCLIYCIVWNGSSQQSLVASLQASKPPLQYRSNPSKQYGAVTYTCSNKEALQNAVKHANATHIEVLVSINEEVIELTIQDNGRGINPSMLQEGRGMQTMKRRADQEHGTLKIEGSPGLGTTIFYRGRIK